MADMVISDLVAVKAKAGLGSEGHPSTITLIERCKNGHNREVKVCCGDYGLMELRTRIVQCCHERAKQLRRVADELI